MHHEDTIIIVQEGELPWCPNCCTFVTDVVGSWCHIQAAQIHECEQLARLANIAHNIRFYINDTVIENVNEFKYLVTILEWIPIW
jgi:hypothetical protein